MLNINLNEEKNGIEIRFDTKPSEEILANLKLNGFRWSGKQKMWYAKQSKQRIEYVNSLCDGNVSLSSVEKEHQKIKYDLWAMTRTNDIENNFEKCRIYDVKAIAAIIRKHIRERFKMCKWSVRSDHNSIEIDLLASPWVIDSDEVKSIVHYVYTFAQSYNYDNSDPMSDYFDVNFYGVYEHSIAQSWNYTQTESNETYEKMSADFAESKRLFDLAEEERKEKEFQEYEKQRAIEKKAAEEKEKIRNNNRSNIEANVVVKDVEPYFVMDCYSANVSKLNSVKEYEDEINSDGQRDAREKCRVTREVHMTKEIYDLFSDQLLDDYSFLDGKGGSSTYDSRCNSMLDWNYMSPEERESVEWFSDNTVAIYCDDELMMIVDPQGYSYARYVKLIDDQSIIDREYSKPEIIEDEKTKETKEKAQALEDISTEIIITNEFRDDWNNSRVDEYQAKIKDWMFANKFKLTKDIIRAITIEELKEAMYKLYIVTNNIQNQFDDAFINYGLSEKYRPITIVEMNGWTGLAIRYAYYIDHQNCKYAQYDKAVELTFKRNGKRKEESIIVYSDIMIYDGWYEIPEELFWEKTEMNGMVAMKSKYVSFDMKAFDAIIEYMQSKNVLPIINTYKPEMRI